MSRQIKFRVWDKENEKYLLPEKQEFVILPTSPSFGATLPYQSELGADCVDWADADLLAGRYELEQYTGLNDKNGKEIYEGDIVKINGNINYYVDFEHGGFWFNNDSRKWKANRPLTHFVEVNDCEVIGNIHEGARAED